MWWEEMLHLIDADRWPWPRRVKNKRRRWKITRGQRRVDVDDALIKRHSVDCSICVSLDGQVICQSGQSASSSSSSVNSPHFSTKFIVTTPFHWHQYIIGLHDKSHMGNLYQSETNTHTHRRHIRPANLYWNWNEKNPRNTLGSNGMPLHSRYRYES